MESLTYLYLSDSALTDFPAFVFRCKNLVLLDLSLNGLSGPIPIQKLSSLKNLKVLNFRNNSFQGHIPAELLNLTKLQVLRLSENNLTGFIPHEIGFIFGLHKLDLSYNPLLGGPIPASLGQLWALEELSLYHCGLNSGIPAHLFLNWTTLTFLDLSENVLEGQIPSGITLLKNLKFLDLSSNQISGFLPSNIGNLSKLSILYLYGNNLTGSIPSSIGELSMLNNLYLNNNYLKGSIPPSIGNLSKLQFLDLSENNLMGSLPPEIWNLKSMIHMVLRSNRFRGPLISTTSQPQGLQVFYNYNNFSGNTTVDLGQKFEMLNISSSIDLRRQICQGMKLLPELLKHCTSTVTIQVETCYLTMNTTMTYAKLPNLGSVDLSNNQFSGCIPENIGEVMPKLMVLALYNNNISGTIPTSIGDMISLYALDLFRNKIMGSIPTYLSNLEDLQSLVLRNNRLSGEIPSLKNCSKLQILDLSENQLSGYIPSWIGQSLTSLRVLSIRSNKFTGTIPKTMSILYSLQVLDAAENCLSGTIPDIFINFTAMTITEKMADNNYDRNHMFYYVVSIDIVAKGAMMDYTNFLSLVTCIDLSRNNFSGRIPESLTKLIGLRVLNLSRNNLIGKIPQKINQLQELESLDLSDNQLSGAIPLNMSSMSLVPYAGHMITFDASTYYGNEDLCGPPLPKTCDSHELVPRFNNDEDLRTGPPEVRQFWISVGLGFGTGFGGWFSILAIKRKWNNAVLKVMDFIVEILITRLQHFFGRRNRCCLYNQF
ncbi:hypothetical protein AMTRI_Chr07g81510 [Amborella trichopoda]